MNRFLLGHLVVTLAFSTALAKKSPLGEPAYCDPKTFAKLEVPAPIDGIKRVHVYQVGEMTLVGLAVGQSDAALTEQLADHYSQYAPEEKSCTWYLNRGSQEAEEAFNQRYVSNPIWSSASNIAKEFEKVISSSFDDDDVSFLSCAVDHKYLAMGCDGMQHRGPSAFAMFLSFTGCSPQSSVAIVEKVWGQNWVSTSKRIAIAQKGYDLGLKKPASRQILQNMLLK